MMIPEYTLSLLIWIIPIIAVSFFSLKRGLVSRKKTRAMFITIAVFTVIGSVLDLVFGRAFFIFPNPHAVVGMSIKGIPVEEFLFYITGLWFILSFYVFCDEWFLKKYNPPDEHYARYRSRIKRLLFMHFPSCLWAILLFVAGLVCKQLLNHEGPLIPGYFFFLVCAVVVPFILFYRITRLFVNWRAYQFVLLVIILISIIWEVTLALPRGYWGYRKGPMLGLFIGVWHGLPLEAVFVWVAGSTIILFYEFIKIGYFTDVKPSSDF
jgi:hypothetical protein